MVTTTATGLANAHEHEHAIAGAGASSATGDPGLKLLLYLSYCVSGKKFPRGRIPRRRRASVVAEL